MRSPYPTFLQTTADSRCKWCAYFQFGTEARGLCKRFNYMVWKIRRRCRQFTFIDEQEYQKRIDLIKLRIKGEGEKYRLRHKEEIKERRWARRLLRAIDEADL